MDTDVQRQIRRRVLTWYRKHGRHDLPWRKTRDPYRILVSEIMLQQTQVPRVIEKYREFLHLFPTVKKLAVAKPGEVIVAWKGLGYNRRALFLHNTAKAVVADYKGKFPSDHDALIGLPGVGDYTARAVQSFAFEQPVAMMDTNHRRFYQRLLFGFKMKKDAELIEVAEKLLPPKKAWEWNQALMDIGTDVCITSKPDCEQCPVKQYCKAYPKILTYISPAKKKKKVVPFKQTERYVRGQIMDLLREKGRKRIVLDGVSEKRVEKALVSLEKDGLLKKVRGVWRLP